MPSTTTVSISEKTVNLTDIIQRTTRAHTAVVLNDHGKDVAVLLEIN
jgi:PHD/YefM family antitoxin component YafN of YafNO toxin-antitoxin module